MSLGPICKGKRNPVFRHAIIAARDSAAMTSSLAGLSATEKIAFQDAEIQVFVPSTVEDGSGIMHDTDISQPTMGPKQRGLVLYGRINIGSHPLSL